MEGVSVYVMVDSERAEVYQLETVSEPQEMKGFVESVEGKSFSIHVKGRPLSPTLYILMKSLLIQDGCLMYDVAGRGANYHALLFVDGER